MKRIGCISLVNFLLLLVLVTSVSAEVSLIGSNNTLNYTRWLPKKAYIAFNYDSGGELSGYRVAFQADGGELFNEWKLKNDNNYEIVFVWKKE